MNRIEDQSVLRGGEIDFYLKIYFSSQPARNKNYKNKKPSK